MSFFKKCMNALSNPASSATKVGYSFGRTFITGTTGYGAAFLAAYLEAPAALSILVASATPSLISALLNVYEYRKVISEKDPHGREEKLRQLAKLKAQLNKLTLQSQTDSEAQPLQSKIEDKVKEINDFAKINRLDRAADLSICQYTAVIPYHNNPATGIFGTINNLLNHTLTGIAAEAVVNYFAGAPAGMLGYLKHLPASFTAAYFSTIAAIKGLTEESKKYEVASTAYWDTGEALRERDNRSVSSTTGRSGAIRVINDDILDPEEVSAMAASCPR